MDIIDPTSRIGFLVKPKAPWQIVGVRVAVLAVRDDDILEWWPGHAHVDGRWSVRIRSRMYGAHWAVVGWRPLDWIERAGMIDLGDSSIWPEPLPRARTY